MARILLISSWFWQFLMDFLWRARSEELAWKVPPYLKIFAKPHYMQKYSAKSWVPNKFLKNPHVSKISRQKLCKFPFCSIIKHVSGKHRSWQFLVQIPLFLQNRALPQNNRTPKSMPTSQARFCRRVRNSQYTTQRSVPQPCRAHKFGPRENVNLPHQNGLKPLFYSP